MSELRELTDRELDVVGGGHGLTVNNQINNWGNVVGVQMNQQFNVASANGIGLVNVDF
jgi:hypothetical protein